MELKRALRLAGYPRVAVAGAGGKTSTLFHLAREIRPPLVLAASTHLSLEQTRRADHHIVLKHIEDTNVLQEERPLSGIWLLTGGVEGDRTTGLTSEILDWLDAFCGFHSLPLLIEADGARQLPLKAPAAHEPAIPSFVDTVIVVAGLSGVGKPLSPAWVHRPERFAELSGLVLGAEISPLAVARVLKHPKGGLKGIPTAARRVALLNQVDALESKATAEEIASSLLPDFQTVVITSLARLQEVPVRNGKGRPVSPSIIVRETVAGVILAAGEGRRYGGAKQLLPWRGKPLVRHVAEVALQAGLSPVVVVTGARAEEVEAALQGLPVEVCYNQDWQEGQGASVRVGVRSLPSQSGAAVFLLADQPQIPLPLLHRLVETHARTLAPIVAPQVRGRRANPVLFDRDLFPELASLSGASGGRALFSRYDIEPVNWDDPSLLLDVDFPQDYQKLLDL